MTVGFVGGNVSVGAGFGVDVHVVASKTETKAKFNIFDQLSNAWNTVVGWFGG